MYLNHGYFVGPVRHQNKTALIILYYLPLFFQQLRALTLRKILLFQDRSEVDAGDASI